ncbi:MAG: glycoside hydrolase family 172 protein [Candidatus Aminicenantales bacterium]
MVKSFGFGALLAGLIVAVCAACSGGRPQVTTGTLFEEMIDLDGLARFPQPAFRTVQFSSFDRRSRVPGGPDWFANADGFGGEPVPNFEAVLRAPEQDGPGEYLMADVPGPGAVVRLWTAAISGRMRVFVDDMDRPLYDGEAEPFFRRPYDIFPEMSAVDSGRFRATVYQRDASYAPIPFAKRLRIVWIGKLDEIHFYHIGIRRYLPGTAVAPFRPADITAFHATIDRVTSVLADPDSRPASPSAKPPQAFEVDLAPGEKRSVLTLEGPGALERFWLRLWAGDLDAGLRQTVLHIVCDDFPWGQVQSPVGDFFGAAPGVNPYRSLPFSVAEDGRMTCRFVMPFERSLGMFLENRGSQTIRVAGEAVPRDFAWDARTMHFRARWRVDHDLIASGEDVQDLPFLLARGRGVYVGTTSILLNPATVPTPWGNWWGEGDEKVFVDGDTVPSIFGTGSEDYYNYSWSAPDIFFFPYCGQPRNDGPGNRGFVTNFRWHVLDAIPFESSIGFSLELSSHERTPGLSYARTGYYYARPGTIDDVEALQPSDLRMLQLPDGWQPAARFGASNSVFYAAEEIMSGRKDTILRDGRLWAGGRLLVWTPEKPGDRKKLRIRVERTGKTQVHITAALTPRSGKLAAWLDGHPAEGAVQPSMIDLYDPFRTLLRTFSLEPAELAAGDHTLVLEYQGADAGVTRPEIGLDFIWVQKLGERP